MTVYYQKISDQKYNVWSDAVPQEQARVVDEADFDKLHALLRELKIKIYDKRKGSKIKMKKILLTALLAVTFANAATAATTYEIQAAVNDEKFIINDEAFEAKTYCMGWDVGDEVIFIDGNANGVCVSAELFNVTRNRTCRVWCE